MVLRLISQEPHEWLPHIARINVRGPIWLMLRKISSLDDPQDSHSRSLNFISKGLVIGPAFARKPMNVIPFTGGNSQ